MQIPESEPQKPTTENPPILTAKDAWDKYKNEYKSGEYTIVEIELKKTNKEGQEEVEKVKIKPALMALKNLPEKEWNNFLNLALKNDTPSENLTKEQKNALTRILITEFEPQHTSSSPLLRGNSLTRRLFMSDNPVLDDSTKQRFFSKDPTVLVNSAKHISDEHLKSLKAGGVGVEDIASVAFFNIVGAAYGKEVTDKIGKGELKGIQRDIFVTLTNVFKGGARITEPPTKLLNDKAKQYIEDINNNPNITKSERRAQIKEVKRAIHEAKEFTKQLEKQILEEHKTIKTRYLELFPELKQSEQNANANQNQETQEVTQRKKPILRMLKMSKNKSQRTEQLGEQTVSEPTNVQHHQLNQSNKLIELNDRLLDLTSTKVANLENELNRPRFKDENKAFSKNLSVAKNNLVQLREKTFKEWHHQGKLSDTQWIAINNKIDDLLNKCNHLQKQYNDKTTTQAPNKFEQYDSRKRFHFRQQHDKHEKQEQKQEQKSVAKENIQATSSNIQPMTPRQEQRTMTPQQEQKTDTPIRIGMRRR